MKRREETCKFPPRKKNTACCERGTNILYLKAIAIIDSGSSLPLPSLSLSLSYFGEILQKKCELKVERDECAGFDILRHIIQQVHGQVEIYIQSFVDTPWSMRSTLPSAARPPLLDHDTALVVDKVHLWKCGFT